MKKKELTIKQQKILSIIAMIIFAVVTVLLVWFVGLPMLKFASKPDEFRLWVEEKGMLGYLGYIGMMILQVVVALLPGEPIEIAAGYAFGAVGGTVLCLLAGTIGSVLVFLLVRYFGVRLVEVFFKKEKLQSLKFLQNSGKRDFLFLLIFMIPGTPKDLMCYFAGLTNIRFPVWLMICSLGRFPSIITSTIGGDALGTQNYVYAIIVFVITLVISGLGLWLYRCICRKHEKVSE